MRAWQHIHDSSGSWLITYHWTPASPGDRWNADMPEEIAIFEVMDMLTGQRVPRTKDTERLFASLERAIAEKIAESYEDRYL